VSDNLTFPELIALSLHDGPGASTYTDSDIVKALRASRGLVAHAAAHLTSTHGIAISRSQLAARIEASPTLQLARAVAEEISNRDALRRERKRVDAADVADDAEADQDIEPARVSPRAPRLARADMNCYPTDALCGARTRRGSACRRIVEPGARRCRLRGGMSTGPRTAEGRQRIADAQRERWRRYREERDQ
jgi:hypothetical protein